MDQNRTQSRQQQRRRDTYAEQVEITDEDILNEGEYEYDDVWPTRMPTSARRYQGLADVRTEVGRAQADVEPFPALRTSRVAPLSKSAIPARRSATQTNIPAVQGNRRNPVGIASNVGSPNTEDMPLQRSIMQGRRVHWLLFVGMAMLIMIMGWIAFNALANWWQVTQDDLHYGRPRTFQTDAVVGHNDSTSHPSHFIALNLNRRIQIIEFPGGDSTKAKIYLGPVLIGQGQDLAVVTLSFKDVNGDGRPDMIINVQDSHFVFINDGGAFRPARPGENVQM
jgi:hypothetical protein